MIELATIKKDLPDWPDDVFGRAVARLHVGMGKHTPN
jgi:hypothetical protein